MMQALARLALGALLLTPALAAAYVQQIVRRGLLGMPAITRVDLGDSELARVIAYLTRPRPAAPTAAGP